MYREPKVIVDSGLGEGIYAASGSAPSGEPSDEGSTFVGTNVVGTKIGIDSPEHHGDKHWIRKYQLTLTLPADAAGSKLHFSFEFGNPIRHAGIHGENEDSVDYGSTHNKLRVDVPYSAASGPLTMWVCTDPEYYPGGVTVTSATVTAKA